MSGDFLMDSADIDFTKGRANQLIPPSTEEAICNCISNGLIVNMYLRNPSPGEVDALLPGKPAEVGLYEYRGIVMLLLRFGDILKAECPVRFMGDLPEEYPKTPGISAVLTDLDTNIVKGVRFLSLRPSFWKVLHALLQELEQKRYTAGKKKLLEELALELPGDKWERAVVKHKII